MERPKDKDGVDDLRAWPLAGADLTNSVSFSLNSEPVHEPYPLLFEQILELVQQASQYQQLKKGANEGI